MGDLATFLFEGSTLNFSSHICCAFSPVRNSTSFLTASNLGVPFFTSLLTM